MKVTHEQFEKLVGEAIDNLSEDLQAKLNNVAIFAEDEPTEEQLNKVERKKGMVLFGLYEGHTQGKRLNYNAVLPDRITLFKKYIAEFSNTKEEFKNQIMKTLKHEIAHHFGSDEVGARRASHGK